MLKNKIVKTRKIQLLNANGKKLTESNWIVNIIFKLLEKNITAQFLLIPDMKFYIILGEDILKPYGVKLDLENKTFEMHIEKIKVIYT